MFLEELKNIKIAVLGLGYVGLPLAVEFGKYYQTVGFDINESRVTQLNHGVDSTLEVENNELAEATLLIFTTNPSILAIVNFLLLLSLRQLINISAQT